jgi:phosphate starvation-inducible PhoH-like protein
MTSKKLRLKSLDEIMDLLGPSDESLRRLEKELKVRIFVHHHPESESATLTIKGSTSAADKALARLKAVLEDSAAARIAPKHLKVPSEKRAPGGAVFMGSEGEAVYPRGANQAAYARAMEESDLVVATGPAGTGKTYLAAACALRMLRSGKVHRIILTRPIVEAGEKLGFLPGDVSEKVHPYLKPLYDAFHSLLGPEKFRDLRQDEVIETVPLAYMRGRTLEKAFIILDEAQNTLPEQMKMFLTRMGAASKITITGDITQIDLKEKDRSGLVLAREILRDVRGARFVDFDAGDVVRHPLVRSILAAYEKWEKEHPAA